MLFKRGFKTERRRRSRQLVNTHVRVFTGITHVEAIGMNLSDVGMCLFTAANLPLESQIEVEFVRPRCNESARRTGIVRHRALYLYGIEFLENADQAALSCSPGATITEPVASERN